MKKIFLKQLNPNPLNVISSTENITNRVVCKKTLDFVAKLENSKTGVILDFLRDKTNNIPLRSINKKLYQYENLFLFRSNGSDAYNLEQQLNFLSQKDFAPKYVKHLQLGDDDFLTILEGDSEALIPYSEAKTLSSKAKNNFKTEILKYLNFGLVNKELFANKDILFVTKSNSNLICADWSDIKPVLSSEKDGLQNFIINWKL